MDAKLKADWVKALRSGEFEQGTAQLRTGDSFCCLGVLCRVANVPIGADGCSLDSYAAINEIVGGDIVSSRLWHMNDDENKSFPEIADYIEQHL